MRDALAAALQQLALARFVERALALGVAVTVADELVEQNAAMALAVATRGYLLENGRVVLEDSTRALQDHPQVKEAYLGG